MNEIKELEKKLDAIKLSIEKTEIELNFKIEEVKVYKSLLSDYMSRKYTLERDLQTAKGICPSCNGTGDIWKSDCSYDSWKESCYACKGKGKIKKT